MAIQPVENFEFLQECLADPEYTGSHFGLPLRGNLAGLLQES